MFYSAFATLLSLLTIMNQTNNGMKFNHCVRISSNQTTTEFDFQKLDNTIYFQYDNSSVNKQFGVICQGLGNAKDNLYIYSDLSSNNVDSIARLEWYYTIDSDGHYFLNFNSYNYTYQNFNLRALINFTYYAIDSDLVLVDTWSNTFDINYSLSDYNNTYTFVDDDIHNYFIAQNVMGNYIRMNISVCYVPLSESELDNAYNGGFNSGYESGYDDGQEAGKVIGYQTGYTDGYTQGATQDAVAVSIFSGIISVGLLPINFFLACLNFEVFGINIGAFVSAMLTVAIVVIVTRLIVNGGTGGNNG